MHRDPPLKYPPVPSFDPGTPDPWMDALWSASPATPRLG